MRATAHKDKVGRGVFLESIPSRAEIQEGRNQDPPCAGARAQSPRSICRRHDDRSSRNGLVGELTRELPKSNEMLPVSSAGIRTPSRLTGEQHLALLQAKIKRFRNAGNRYDCLEPLLRAVTMLLVARRTSNTTHTVAPKSRCSTLRSRQAKRKPQGFSFPGRYLVFLVVLNRRNYEPNDGSLISQPFRRAGRAHLRSCSFFRRFELNACPE